MKKLFLLCLCAAFATISAAQEVPAAGAILSRAFAQAKKEKKNVFVIFHASWCGWCKKLDASINDPLVTKAFHDNYVITHLTVLESAGKKQLENPGAIDTLTKYKGGNSGLPFFLVFNRGGKLLGNSLINADNMGCPASEAEVNGFLKLLKSTSKINAADLENIRMRFRKNDSH